MRFSVIRKPLALLLILTIVGAISAMAINSVSGQQEYQGIGQDQSGGYAAPGAPGISLGPGTNTVAMSVSIASQDDNKIYFQVNELAVLDPQTQQYTVYELSNALPGIMDTSSNMVQIDIGKLQSSIKGTSQASMDDLYSVLRPSVNSLMVIADLSQQGEQGAQTTYQVQSLKVITPDGKANEFDLTQAMSVVVDSTAMRVFTVGFDQMYSFVNTYVTNIQNNYYTQINYNIVTGPTIVVSPPVAYPVLTPITFPTSWPVYYPVPVPVPIPVITVRPHPPSIRPSMKPSFMPSMKPTMSPTGKPTVSPTMKPSVGPSGMPTVSPTMKPSMGPSGMPTVSPTMKPSIKPTFKPSIFPTASVKPSFKPTIFPTKVITATAKPTMGPSFKPTIFPTKIATYKPTYKPTLGGGGGLPSGYKPQVSYKPTLGGKVPTAYKPITTYKPVTGVGGRVPTTYRPIATKMP